jgi:hypothetical protein
MQHEDEKNTNCNNEKLLPEAHPPQMSTSYREPPENENGTATALESSFGGKMFAGASSAGHLRQPDKKIYN